MSQSVKDNLITRDLMAKLSGDVTACMLRTLSLVDSGSRLPIGISAGASCIAIIAALLNNAAGGETGLEPDPDYVLLAALLVARIGIGGDDPIGDAYRDMKLLKDAQP